MDLLDIIFYAPVVGLATMVFYQMRRADRAEDALARVETVIREASKIAQDGVAGWTPSTSHASPVKFEGEHVPHVESVGEPNGIGWSRNEHGLAITRYDNGSVIIASSRDDQPTRLYELSFDDVAALRELLA